MRNKMCIQMNQKFQFANIMSDEFSSFVWLVNFVIEFFERFLTAKIFNIEINFVIDFVNWQKCFCIVNIFFVHKLNVCYLVGIFYLQFGHFVRECVCIFPL